MVRGVGTDVFIVEGVGKDACVAESGWGAVCVWVGR